MIVLDTSVIYALLDRSDRRHRMAADWYQRLDEELITTPLVLAEADHLATTRGGPVAGAARHGHLGREAPVRQDGVMEVDILHQPHHIIFPSHTTHSWEAIPEGVWSRAPQTTVARAPGSLFVLTRVPVRENLWM